MTRHCWRCTAPLGERPPTSCSNCGQGHFNNPKPAAEALVEREGNVLLVKRARDPWRDHWDIPGGFCDAGEHPIHTAERELLEETGLHARCIALIGIWIDEYGAPQADGLQEMTLNIAYLAQALETKPTGDRDDETSDADWFSLEALPTNLAFPAHVVPVLQAAQRVLKTKASPLIDRP